MREHYTNAIQLQQFVMICKQYCELVSLYCNYSHMQKMGYTAETWPRSAADRHVCRCNLFLQVFSILPRTHMYTVHLFLRVILPSATITEITLSQMTAALAAIFGPRICSSSQKIYYIF